MPRDLPVGNGSLLINFDHTGQIRDIYWPHVGQENHTSGQVCRMGVWVDGLFSWLDSDDWQRRLCYGKNSLVTDSTLKLSVRTSVGGIARYENDYYHQVSNDIATVPGNPWFICSLWLAQWYIASASREEDLQQALKLIQWTAERTLLSGVMAEQVHPFSNAPLSVSPLTWSHATYVATILEYRQKVEELTNG